MSLQQVLHTQLRNTSGPPATKEGSGLPLPKQLGQATGRIMTMCLEFFQNRGTTGSEEKLETVIHVHNIEVITNGKPRVWFLIPTLQLNLVSPLNSGVEMHLNLSGLQLLNMVIWPFLEDSSAQLKKSFILHWAKLDLSQ